MSSPDFPYEVMTVAVGTRVSWSMATIPVSASYSMGTMLSTAGADSFVSLLVVTFFVVVVILTLVPGTTSDVTAGGWTTVTLSRETVGAGVEVEIAT